MSATVVLVGNSFGGAAVTDAGPHPAVVPDLVARFGPEHSAGFGQCPSHSPFVSRPDEIAALLAKLAIEAGMP